MVLSGSNYNQLTTHLLPQLMVQDNLKFNCYIIRTSDATVYSEYLMVQEVGTKVTLQEEELVHLQNDGKVSNIVNTDNFTIQSHGGDGMSTDITGGSTGGIILFGWWRCWRFLFNSDNGRWFFRNGGAGGKGGGGGGINITDKVLVVEVLREMEIQMDLTNGGVGGSGIKTILLALNGGGAGANSTVASAGGSGGGHEVLVVLRRCGSDANPSYC